MTARNRTITRLEVTLADGRKVHGISYGMLGKEGIVTLHGYALEGDFAKHLPVFNQMADSFRYDEGFQFVPGARTTARPIGIDWPGALVGALVGGTVGGAIGGVYLLIRRVRRLMTRAASARQAEPGEYV